MRRVRVEDFSPVFFKNFNDIHGIGDIYVILNEVGEGGEVTTFKLTNSLPKFPWIANSVRLYFLNKLCQ